MDDSLKTLDLSAEGTISIPPVVPPVVSDPTPTPQPTIVTQSSGPTDKKPMGKKTKIVAGVLSAILLFAGLGVGLFLAKSRQNVTPRAYSPGNCRCSGTSWICENEQGGFDYQGEEPSCQTGTPPETVSQTVVTNPNTGVQTTTSQTVVFTNPTTGTTTTSTYTGATGTSTNTTGGTGSVNTGGTTVTTSGGSTTGGTGGPTLSTGAGGVQVVRTGACGQCGGQGQGGCDNMPTSYPGESSQQCGFGCVGGLYFCPASGSCQASCPDGIISAGPLSSNKSIADCLTTGVGCNTGNAKGVTQAMLVAASGGNTATQTNQQALNDAIGKYNSSTCGISCNAWDGKPFCLSDAPGGVQGNPGGCNAALVAMSGQNNSWGGIAQSSKVNCLTSSCPYISPSVINGKVTWDQTQLCLIFPTVCGGDKSKFGSLIWDFNTKSFDQASLNALLALIRKTDPTAQLNLWNCPAGTATWGQGCNSGNPTAGASSMSTSYCGIQQIDIDGGGGHISVNFANANCGGTPPTTITIPGTPPYTPPSGGSSPTPTPTTTTQSYACYQLSIMRNGNNISAANVQVGDALVMRGFATATNTTVSRMRFVVSINGVAQAPVDVNATLFSGQYQADLPYTITQAASYSVTTTPISP